MQSFTSFLQEAKATPCGRCGTTHVAPKDGGTCPAVKNEELEDPNHAKVKAPTRVIGKHGKPLKQEAYKDMSQDQRDKFAQSVGDRFRAKQRSDKVSSMSRKRADVKEEVEVDEALERDGPNKPFNIGSGIAKSDAGKAYKDRKAQQRRDLNKKNDPGAAKKGLGLGVLDKDKARVKAKKNSMKEDVESVEEAKSYRNVMVTHDGETFKSKSFSTKKAADDHHYKMTQATDKRGKKIYKSITTESFNPGKPLAEVLGKAAFKRREHEFEAEMDRQNAAKRKAANDKPVDHHIYADGKPFKMKGKPVIAKSRSHARNLMNKLKSHEFNKDKKFSAHYADDLPDSK